MHTPSAHSVAPFACCAIQNAIAVRVDVSKHSEEHQSTKNTNQYIEEKKRSQDPATENIIRRPSISKPYWQLKSEKPLCTRHSEERWIFRGTLNVQRNLLSNPAARLTSAPYMFPNRCADELQAICENRLHEERWICGLIRPRGWLLHLTDFPIGARTNYKRFAKITFPRNT